MALFTSSLRNIDYNNPTEALIKLINHVQQLQDDLEYLLMNLDSSNINELNIAQTPLKSADGKTISGEDGIHLDCGSWD
jgi:hypothetical protein